MPTVAIILISSASVIAIALAYLSHRKGRALRPLVLSSAVTHQELTPEGSVLVRGELWLARSFDGDSIPAGTAVIVVGFQEHRLLVRVNS